MSDNTQRKILVAKPLVRPTARVIPQRPNPSTSDAVSHGTNLTLYFLAIENFLNRYPRLAFIDECVQLLRARLELLAKSNLELFNSLRSFVSGMPLDAISTSAHPKKIKQLMLETLLNPQSLNETSLCTESGCLRQINLHETIRDLQCYAKLCELSSNAVYAREALNQIVFQSMLLKDEEKKQFVQASESITFKYFTDKAFCAAQKAQSQPIDRYDIALESILLFRTFEELSLAVIAAAGETYESMQQRMQKQRKQLTQFKSDCQRISTTHREALQKYITHSWKHFVQNDKGRRERQNRFLEFLAGPHL